MTTAELELPRKKVEAATVMDLVRILREIAERIDEHRKQFAFQMAWPRQTIHGSMPELFAVGTKSKKPLEYSTAGSNIQHGTANYPVADLGLVADDWGALHYEVNTRANPAKLEAMVRVTNRAIRAARENKRALDRGEEMMKSLTRH